MYWLRFGPAPPWQLDDLQPIDPTNAPPLSRIWRGSFAERLSAPAARMKQMRAAFSNTRKA
jgi:hypothetical protein